jgi:hypothetical protein
MPISTAVSVAQRASRARRQGLIRVAFTTAGSLGMLLSSTCPSAAQTSAAPARTWEFRVASGAFVPTGSQRKFLKDAQVTAAQLSWLVHPSFAITGTFGWARSRDLSWADSPKLDVFTSDLGVELRPVQWFAERAVSFRPFVGLGAGARSYNYRKLDIDATSNLAGYGAVGGELGIGRVGLRLELRDYATGFKPLVGTGKSATRNDIVIMGALSFNRRRAARS